MSPTVIELREGDQPVDAPLADEVGRVLAGSGVVSAAPALRRGEWTLVPGTKVGAVQLGDVEVRIAPKIPIRRVLFLLGYALNPTGWRDTDVPVTAAPDLLTAVAYAFARQAERATAAGLLQGYRTVEESSTVLRGRVREADQLRRFGLPLPLEVRYDDFTVDTDENRLLLAATERVLRLPRLSGEVRRVLRRLLLVTFADVSSVRGRRPSLSWRPNRLNARYHVALRLGEMILAAESFEHQRGSLRTSGFFFDMAKVFEDFVCVAIREALAPEAGRAHLQYRTHLDHAGAVVMKPDLVITRDGRPVAVLDAKYKAEKPSGFPNADIYQMLAYCTVLGLDTGHVLYARGNGDPAVHEVRGPGAPTIRCSALDLSAAPAGSLAAIAAIAAPLGRSAVGLVSPRAGR